MNRFIQSIDNLRNHLKAQNHELLLLLEELDKNDNAIEISDGATEKSYQLPYSSNPKPISEPWRKEFA